MARLEAVFGYRRHGRLRVALWSRWGRLGAALRSLLWAVWGRLGVDMGAARACFGDGMRSTVSCVCGADLVWGRLGVDMGRLGLVGCHFGGVAQAKVALGDASAARVALGRFLGAARGPWGRPRVRDVGRPLLRGQRPKPLQAARLQRRAGEPPPHRAPAPLARLGRLHRLGHGGVVAAGGRPVLPRRPGAPSRARSSNESSCLSSSYSTLCYCSCCSQVDLSLSLSTFFSPTFVYLSLRSFVLRLRVLYLHVIMMIPLFSASYYYHVSYHLS